MSDDVIPSVDVSTNTFAKFNLSPDVNLAIEKLGFTEPTPVQNAVVPVLLTGRTDLIALANTGTGKTGAFGIPLIERITADKSTQALVLCPTRELALQVSQNLQAFGTQKGIRVASIVGGESYRKQFDVLRTSPQIIVSTPGRLIDLLEQNKINLSAVQYFVLDEADEMLSFGFKEALETIWSTLEKGGQEFNTWLFSATMNPAIQRLTHRYLKTPKEFFLQKVQDASRVESFAAVVYEEDKPDALCLALLQTKDFYGIVFCQTKQQVDQLEHKIRECGFKVQSLHGDKTQAERTTTIKRLKNRDVMILVATDVAARGLDIEDLTHVVNYDLPWDHETYTHRIGRTARAGKTGIVWNFCKPKDVRQMKNLERALKIKFNHLSIATADQIKHQLTENWMKTLASFQPTAISTESIKRAAQTSGLDEAFTAQTELWMARVLQFFHIGLPKNLRAPRVMDFTKLEDRGPSGMRSGGRPDSRSRYDSPRGGFGGGRSFGGRSSGGSRPYGRSSEGSFDRGPDRSFDRGADRGPDRSFERPSNFGAEGNRPDGRFNGNQADRPAGPGRFGGDRPAGRFNDRPAGRFGGGERSSDRPAGERSFDRPRSSSGSEGGGGFSSRRVHGKPPRKFEPNSTSW